jgi:retron-type reverse transcriptase
MAFYEQDVCSFSYGFRPGRSCHQALHDLRQGLLNKRIQHVIDCDISSFFDNLRHGGLLDILRKRVKDGRLLKLIEMWLKAGIMDGKELVFPEKGSPQGSVISPLLANVYLHEVLDKWFAATRQTGMSAPQCLPRATGGSVYRSASLVGFLVASRIASRAAIWPRRSPSARRAAIW